MKRMIMVGCILAQMIASIAVADEMPIKATLKGNRQTLEGMPLSQDKISTTGTVKGFIQTFDGKPLAGGDVFFFNDKTGPAPAPEKYWRVPDAIAPMDDNGGFSIVLSAGRYYIGAIQRKGDNVMIGPPSEGDIFFAGKIKYEVLPLSQNNLKVIRGGEPFSRNLAAKGKGITAIEGIVIDVSGKPVENAIVFAYIIPEMNNRPLFVSERTVKDGVFHLRIAGAGTYYLRVRDVYGGGMPVAGAFMGTNDGNNPKVVIVKDGEVIKGINLTGEKLHRRTPKSK